jgi:hypothetical protein
VRILAHADESTMNLPTVRHHRERGWREFWRWLRLPRSYPGGRAKREKRKLGGMQAPPPTQVHTLAHVDESTMNLPCRSPGPEPLGAVEVEMNVTHGPGKSPKPRPDNGGAAET